MSPDSRPFLRQRYSFGVVAGPGAAISSGRLRLSNRISTDPEINGNAQAEAVSSAKIETLAIMSSLGEDQKRRACLVCR